MAAVLFLESRDLDRAAMVAVDLGKRGARRRAMVEERIVEIEEDGACHRRRRSPPPSRPVSTLVRCRPRSAGAR
jgi:hypothetical protein